MVMIVSRLYFFDIDGTLIDCPAGMNEMSKRTIDSLNRLKENGDYVFLSTGRCKCFIVDEVMWYPFDGYVTCNGGYVEFKNKEVYKSVIDGEIIKKTHDLCKKHNWLYYFESNDYIYVLDKEDDRNDLMINHWKMKKETIIDEYDYNEIETYVGMIVINNLNEVKIVEKEIGPYFDVQKHQHGLSFDLTPKNESKGKGIIELVKYLDLSIEDTIAFGDGNNDIEMLQTAGIGIAMGNAVENAKKAANYITKSVLEDGISEALQELKLL